MASCLQLSVSGIGQASAATAINGVLTYAPLPWVLGDAVLTNGVYSCPSGSHLLLTYQEVNALSSAPSQWTVADGLSVGWSVLGIWLSVAAVMFLGKIINWGSERDTSES